MTLPPDTLRDGLDLPCLDWSDCEDADDTVPVAPTGADLARLGLYRQLHDDATGGCR